MHSLIDIASNSGYVYSGISKIANRLSRGLLNRCVLFDVAKITTLAFTVFVFLTFVIVNSPRSIMFKSPSWSLTTCHYRYLSAHSLLIVISHLFYLKQSRLFYNYSNKKDIADVSII